MGKQVYWRMLRVAAFLMLVPWAAQGQIDPTAAQKLLAGDGAFGDSFGYAVSLSDDGSTARSSEHGAMMTRVRTPAWPTCMSGIRTARGCSRAH